MYTVHLLLNKPSTKEYVPICMQVQYIPFSSSGSMITSDLFSRGGGSKYALVRQNTMSVGDFVANL